MEDSIKHVRWSASVAESGTEASRRLARKGTPWHQHREEQQPTASMSVKWSPSVEEPATSLRPLARKARPWQDTAPGGNDNEHQLQRMVRFWDSDGEARHE